jgi:dynein heavy chain
LIKTYCNKVAAVNTGGGGSRMIPWAALKYLIGEAMYGGRVSDHYDRRILSAYLDEYFGDFLFDGFHKFMFYADEEARVRYELPPPESSYDEQSRVIDELPDAQTPEVLGLHANADVAHSTRAAKALWSNVLSLQSKLSISASSNDESAGSSDGNGALLAIVNEILNVVTNEDFEFDLIKLQRQRGDEVPSPTTVVLFQEIERHNALKLVLRHSLRELVKALSGEIGMSRELDAVADSLSRGRLPEEWKSVAPPTDKDVQSWMTWYKTREKQYKSWAVDGEPKVIWLSGLHCPETYIAALIQTACRSRGWPLDASTMYTEVTPYVSADEIDAKPEIGCYISGLFLEGAIWDAERRVLAHPSDRGLARELPILRLVPIERTTMPSSSSSSSTTNAFKAPVYFTQSRRDAMGRGLVFQADLASSEHASAWILRGVACVLNIDA